MKDLQPGQTLTRRHQRTGLLVAAVLTALASTTVNGSVGGRGRGVEAGPGVKGNVVVVAAGRGHGVDPRTLPPNVRDAFREEEREGKKVDVKERSLLEEIAERFRENLKPLTAHKKLGILVFQYPPWFTYSSRNLGFIIVCKELMKDLPIAVEFRHGSWLAPEKREKVFSFLKEQGLIYVAADEPQFGDLRTVPYLSEVTDRLPISASTGGMHRTGSGRGSRLRTVTPMSTLMRS